MKEGLSIDEIMPISKRKGEYVSRLEDSFLEWFLKQDWFSSKYPDLEACFIQELEYREVFDYHVGMIERR